MVATGTETAVPAPPSEADLRAAVAAAVRAPSVYNTQPWRFALCRRSVEVYADRSRQLQVLDPQGRELVVSCGAAVGCARIALRARGWRTAMTARPSDDADHLATIHVLDVRPPLHDHADMAAAAQRRRSIRSTLSARRVYDTHIEALLAEVAGGPTAAVALRDAALRDDVLVLQARADAVLEADPAYREELGLWVRHRHALDGIPAGSVQAAPLRRPSDWTQRRFPADQGGYPRPVPTSAADDPLVLVLSGPDSTEGWLSAGEALARVLVRAEVLGLGGVPMTQLAEVPAERERLRQLLRIAGQPQALLRLGHPVGSRIVKPAPRRPLDDVLRPSDGETR